MLPKFPRDTTDRNRTSPFAFTGNKFEFRMLGSSNSISCANIMLNSAVAESLKIYADRLEGAKNFETALHEMIKKTIKDHKRILFNGNGYDESWEREAEKRGLLNYKTTPDCMPHSIDEKNVKMLTFHKVFTETELKSRCEIMLDNYCKTVIIEANTMADMSKREILPAVEAYIGELSEIAKNKVKAFGSATVDYEKSIVEKLSSLCTEMMLKTNELENELSAIKSIGDIVKESYEIRDKLIPLMGELRKVADEAETMTASKYWPFPTYGDLLFGVK